MDEGTPATERVTEARLRDDWDNLVQQVARGERRLLIEQAGTPVAAIISGRDLQRLQQFEAQISRDLQVLEASRNAFKDVPDEELEAEISKAIAEVRAEMRAERQNLVRSP